MSIPIRQEEKIDRGRAFKCHTCGHIDEQRRIVLHMYKKHIRYDQAPFYCMVCTFRSIQKKDLTNHVLPGVYDRHADQVALLRNAVDEDNMLMQSLNPKVPVEGIDYTRLGPDESKPSGARGGEARRLPSLFLKELYCHHSRTLCPTF